MIASYAGDKRSNSFLNDPSPPPFEVASAPAGTLLNQSINQLIFKCPQIVLQQTGMLPTCDLLLIDLKHSH